MSDVWVKPVHRCIRVSTRKWPITWATSTRALSQSDYLLGDEFSAADIQMSFIGEIARAQGKLGNYPHVAAWVDRFQARPAYIAALKKGGKYDFAPH